MEGVDDVPDIVLGEDFGKVWKKKRLFTTKVLFSATDVYFYQNRCIDFYYSPVAAIAKYSYAPDPHAQNKKLKHFINKKLFYYS